MKQTDKRKSSTFSFDDARLQPRAVEVEEAVLGAVLLERDAFERVCDTLSGEMFYEDRNRTVYGAVMALYAKHRPVDMLTVTGQLREDGNLEAVDGPSYISQLADMVASTAHLEYHAEIVRDRYIRRKLIEFSTRSASEGYDESETLDDVLARLNAGVEQLYELLAGKDETSHISAVLKQSIHMAYERMDRAEKGKDIGITTGFARLDRVTNGWKPNGLVILAARPGAGKTAIAIHMAKRAAIRGHKVVFLSLEMGNTELTDRMIVGDSGIDKNEYKSGRIRREDLLKAENTAFNDLAKLNIYIDATPRQTALTITGKLRLLKKRGQCSMAIIDYLQLVKPSTKGRSRDEEVGEITRELKLAAKELGIPVLLLSQMNREVEKRGNREPVLSDLRESGSIEQDADVVVFIQRPNADGETEMVDTATGKKNIIRLFVRKNRDGMTDVIKITHNESLTAFYDYDYSQNSGTKHESVNPDRFHEPAGNELPF
jgi:replicative DNA helicase